MAQLTDKQEFFCLEYLKDLNATQAAIRAGYSERTAKAIGCENLTKPDIVERIAQMKAERAAETRIDAAWVLNELVKQYDKAEQSEKDQIAMKALDLIGKHIDVSAFSNKLELTGQLTMSHEEALKALE